MSDQLFSRQERETDKAWAAFVVYRDLGPEERTRAKVAEQLGKSARWIEIWSRRWNWTERARAYDVHMDRAGTDAQVEAIREMKQRQVALGRRYQEVALKALETLADDIEAGIADDKVRKDIAKLAEFGAKLERVNLDEPDEIIKNKVQIEVPDYSKLTVEQLKTLREAKLALEAKE
jgi:hypothetical protein